MHRPVDPQQLVSSNAGYSGTPLWKLKQQGAVPRFDKEEEEEAAAAAAAEEAELQAALLRVSVDAVSFGRTEASEARGEKPLVRHLIVKDLRKVAARSKVPLPSGGLFEKSSVVQLFAIFDGQSCAESAGPFAAEWCAKQLLPKLLRNLSALPAGYENKTFVKATLTKTFEDLDKDILRGQPMIHDGCGAAVALTVGETAFVSVIGKCDVVIGGSGGNLQSLGNAQGRPELPEERQYVIEKGASLQQGDGGQVFIRAPNGAMAHCSRSLGDRAWKGDDGGVPGSIPLVRCKPQTTAIELSWADKHQYLVLSSMPVVSRVTVKDMGAVASDYLGKPRACAGEIAGRAVEADGRSQCTTMAVYFIPKDDKVVMPAAKKAKKEAESVRLRHIVVKWRDCAQPFDPVRNRPVNRTREEAETVLRTALRELTNEAKGIKLPVDPNKAKLVALQPTPKYISLCKEISECATAQKGGGMLGDLGWLGPPELAKFGPAFAEMAKALGVGQWSDLAPSEQGMHLFQRIA